MFLDFQFKSQTHLQQVVNLAEIQKKREPRSLMREFAVPKFGGRRNDLSDGLPNYLSNAGKARGQM